MITSELLGYIRAEFAKGRTREEVHTELVRSGGWSEADLSEAFRTVIPMQGFVAPNAIAQHTITTGVIKNKTKLKSFWGDLVFIVIGLICVASWYFYSPQIINFWNSGINKITELTISYFGAKTDTETVNTIAKNNPILTPTLNIVRDCGVGTTPDLKNPLTYENDTVLTCLGNSALRCENARAVLKDDLFPTVFQIIKNQETCNFRLSYGQDSTLVDITGKKLAGQYISCPLNIVKAIDNTNSTTPKFITPSETDLSKYASQIYFYGTLGLFVENNLDQNKIQALGCNGEYIQSMIASYNVKNN